MVNGRAKLIATLVRVLLLNTHLGSTLVLEPNMLPLQFWK